MNYTQNAPVNSSGELVVSTGTGDTSVAGFLPSGVLPVNDAGAVVMSPLSSNPESINVATKFKIVPNTGEDLYPKFQAMAQWCYDNKFTGELKFPSGTYLCSGTVDFTSQVVAYKWYDSKKTRGGVVFPTLRGSGSNAGTTIQYTGTGTGQLFRFRVNPARNDEGYRAVRIYDIDFRGPGLFISKTTITAAIVANDTQITVADASKAAIGDAVCISLPKGSEWWATITGISGNVITLGSRQAIPVAQPTVGSTVLFYKYSTAIQMGGTRSTSELGQQVEVNNVSIEGFLTGMSFDDLTNASFGGTSWMTGCEFFLEAGYNPNGIKIDSPFFGIGIHTESFSCTCTNASPVVTTTDTAMLTVGMRPIDSAALPTLNFPEQARIISIDSPTQFTLSENYTGTTGTRTLAFVMGSGLAIQVGSSPFLSNTSVNNRTSACAITLLNPTIGYSRNLIRVGAAQGVSEITVQGVYAEGLARLIDLGEYGVQGNAGIRVYGALHRSDLLVGPAVHQKGSDQGAFTSVVELSLQTGATCQFPVYKSETFSSRLSFMGSSVGQASGVPMVQFVNGSFYDLQNSQRFEYNTGQLSYTKAANPSGYFARVWPPTPSSFWFPYAFDGIIPNASLSANLTIADAADSPPAGRQFRIVLKQDSTGGRTVTLGNSFVTAAGAAIGTITAGTANQVLAMTFVGNGAKWVLTSGTPTWI